MQPAALHVQRMAWNPLRSVCKWYERWAWGWLVFLSCVSLMDIL